MFNKEFYPTPGSVIEMMTTGLDLSGKTVLEPSAGSGNIVSHLQNLGAHVLACEKHPSLQKIVGSMCQFLKPDFFEVEASEVSHIHAIIMNPPFSNADKHIQHAFDIAPGGCQIVALCNVETIKSRYSTSRKLLSEIIDKNGSWRNIGDVFSNAERTTDVEVALINLFKPKEGDSEFEDYFFDTNADDDLSSGGAGIMKHNEIREIVNRYVGAVQMFDSVMEANKAINDMISPISSGLDIAFGARNTRNQFTEVTRDSFKKDLQKSAWRSVFNKMNMGKYVTSGVMADVNKFVEQQQHIPFTMTNVYRMIELVVGTHAGRMDRVLTETFDYICSLSADNSEAGEKWKTNSNYKVNRRFIMGWITEVDSYGGMKIRYGSREKIDDIIKALCYLTGRNYDEQISIELWFNGPYKIKIDGKFLQGYDNHSYTNDSWSFTSRVNAMKESGRDVEVVKIDQSFGQWHEWPPFFRVRGYKKGTMHFEFIDENVWMEFNRRVAKIKGWTLPSKTDRKNRGTERASKNGVSLFHN